MPEIFTKEFPKNYSRWIEGWAFSETVKLSEIHDSEFKRKDLVDLYAKIYSWSIEKGIMTFDQLLHEGVAPYPVAACNQFVSGMFIRKDGTIQACPGNDTEESPFIYGYIRETSLKNAWKKSLGYRLRKELDEIGRLTVTQPCYAKTEGVLVSKGEGSIVEDFYSLVIKKVKEAL